MIPGLMRLRRLRHQLNARISWQRCTFQRDLAYEHMGAAYAILRASHGKEPDRNFQIATYATAIAETKQLAAPLAMWHAMLHIALAFDAIGRSDEFSDRYAQNVAEVEHLNSLID